MLTITVRERSVTAISESEFRSLERSTRLWNLVDRKLLSLVRSGDIPFGVRAGPHVGEVLVDESTRLVVAEKSPGALRALLSWAAPDDFLELSHPSLVGSTSPVLDAFARAFLTHLGDYLRHGRLRAYVRVREMSAYPRGRIDVRASLALFARGTRGRLVCEHPELTPDLMCNRLVALGLRLIDEYLVVRGGPAELLSIARTYAPLFEDVAWQSIAHSDWGEQRQRFDRAIEDHSAWPDLASALRYARAIALHLGAWPDTPGADDIPASYFLNLESLFEDAVRSTVTVLTEDVTKGGSLGVGLFADVGDRYIVDPDIVVGLPPAVRLVADCKYKELEGTPAHPDVYQLVAHCAPLGGTTGLLVYPGTSTEVRYLGLTTSGLKLFYATVAIETLKEALATVLTECGALRVAA